MSVTLQAGDYLWNQNGMIEIDDRGYGVICTEETIITFDSSEIETASLSGIIWHRNNRGVDPDTGLPIE